MQVYTFTADSCIQDMRHKYTIRQQQQSQCMYNLTVKFDITFIKLYVCVNKSYFLSWAIKPVFADPVTNDGVTRQPTNNYDPHNQTLWLSNWVTHMASAVPFRGVPII